MNQRNLFSLMVACALGVMQAGCTPGGPGSTRTLVEGGNTPPMPPLSPLEAHVDPAALEAAASAAQDGGADALLVVRNGHVIFERYWHRTSFVTSIDAGAWQGVIDDLLAGALAEDRKPLPDAVTPDSTAIARAAGVPYETYLSRRLWRPLGAFNAELAPGLRVVQGDWIRIGEVLANDGVYMGEEIVRPGWARCVLARHTARDEPSQLVSAKDLYRLPGAHGGEMWVVPSLRLVILRTGEEENAGNPGSNAKIAELVLRGVTDRPGSPAGGEGMTDPAMLVPAH